MQPGDNHRVVFFYPLISCLPDFPIHYSIALYICISEQHKKKSETTGNVKMFIIQLSSQYSLVPSLKKIANL